MKRIYMNKNFKTRDYEATNIVACKAYPGTLDNNWIETTKEILVNLNRLFIEGEKEFYGFL